MNNEQKRIALARKAGFHNIRPNPGPPGCPPLAGTYSENDTALYGIPDHLSDLNAIAALEGLLTGEEQLMYADLLCREVLRLPTSKCLYYLVATATASQRADALCAVWGLEETK